MIPRQPLIFPYDWDVFIENGEVVYLSPEGEELVEIKGYAEKQKPCQPSKFSRLLERIRRANKARIFVTT